MFIFKPIIRVFCLYEPKLSSFSYGASGTRGYFQKEKTFFENRSESPCVVDLLGSPCLGGFKSVHSFSDDDYAV